MSNKRIQGTPYIGELPEKERHSVTGWWCECDGHKELVATSRDMAAYHFATDRVCDKCGRPTGAKHRITCDECRYKGIAERMRDQPSDYVPVDGAMIYSHRYGAYYHDMDAAEEDVEAEREEGNTADPLLCWTEPVPCPAYGVWDDPLHDDDDVDWWDGDCQAALDALNAAMAKAAPQVWRPTYHPVLSD